VIPHLHIESDRIVYWDRYGIPEIVRAAAYSRHLVAHPRKQKTLAPIAAAA